MPLLLRNATPADVPALAHIYGANVRQGTGTFELDAPTHDEMATRLADVQGKGLPWLVAEDQGVVMGYAYANHFRLRPAYRYTLEDSIYIDPAHQRRGLGRLLLAELLARCTALGARQMLAVIGDSQNHGSIGVHRACGFTPIGRMVSVGWKFERWLDVELLQRPLGLGADEPPRGEPAIRLSAGH